MRQLADSALRRIHFEIAGHGLTPEEIEDGQRSTFVPWARGYEEILALQDAVEGFVRPQPGDEWAEPQILLRWPDRAPQSWLIPPHVDEPPPWAEGRTYKAIVGVALSRSTVVDGCLCVYPGDSVHPVRVSMHPGDVVVMEPGLRHASGRNASGAIRYAVYFRLLNRTGVRD
jgi:hypothetical protein